MTFSIDPTFKSTTFDYESASYAEPSSASLTSPLYSPDMSSNESSFFGAAAAQRQSAWFKNLTDFTYGSLDAIATDSSRPSWQQTGALILKDSYAMPVLAGIGVLNNIAGGIENPMGIWNALTDPIGTAKTLGKSVVGFVNERDPARQAQTLFTNFGFPAASAAGAFGKTASLADGLSDVGNSAVNLGKSAAGAVGRVLDETSGFSLLPKSLSWGADLLTPSFSTKFYAAPTGKALSGVPDDLLPDSGYSHITSEQTASFTHWYGTTRNMHTARSNLGNGLINKPELQDIVTPKGLRYLAHLDEKVPNKWAHSVAGQYPGASRDNIFHNVVEDLGPAYIANGGNRLSSHQIFEVFSNLIPSFRITP